MSYIKVDRKIVDWEWFEDGNMVKLWLYLLVNAKYKDTKKNGIRIKRGQLITGRKKLADELGMTEQQIRTSLKRLEKTQEITIKSTNRYSLITIVKYDLYQGDDAEDNQQINQQITSKQPTDNHNKRNIRKKERKEDIYNTLPVYDPSINRKMEKEEEDELLRLMGRA